MPWDGHVGYGIRPSARRLATWAMGRILDEARGLGLDRVLAVCAVDPPRRVLRALREACY